MASEDEDEDRDAESEAFGQATPPNQAAQSFTMDDDVYNLLGTLQRQTAPTAARLSNS